MSAHLNGIVVLTPEHRLWRGVLQQAYDDAEMESCADGSDTNESAKARAFLRADDVENRESLSLVCEFAEVPVDRVVHFARREYRIAA